MAARRVRTPTHLPRIAIHGVPLASVPRLFVRPRKITAAGPRHVFFCFVDHFEPYWGRPPRSRAWERTERWVRDYPRSVEGIHDTLGRPPRHSFFYPAEDYDGKILEGLSSLCRRGHADVDVHLHHDRDTSEGFREKILTFVERLHAAHGLLPREPDGRIRYAFVHGNWALDNARPDGRWCGVNDELTVLRETGCCADFTLPCAPEPGQTRMVNSIYYAIDDPRRPRSHDWGPPARVGQRGVPDALLMIQGPLAWNWHRRKWGVLPRLENGDLHGANVPTLARLRLWLAAGVGLIGRPEWIFIKLHTHGAMEINSELFLAGAMRRFHQQLAAWAEEHPEFRYYYVTAREMASLVHQAEQHAVEPRLDT